MENKSLGEIQLSPLLEKGTLKGLCIKITTPEISVFFVEIALPKIH